MSVTRVYDKASSVMLVLVMLMACQVTGQSIPKPISTSTLPTPHMQPVSSPATQPLPTPSPTPWPLEIITVQETVPTCTQLLQLVPGKSTLQDVYKLVGYPNHKRDLPSGIALGYYSKHIKFKHIVLVVLPLQIVDNSSGLLEWLKRGCQQDAGDRAGHTRADFRRCPLVRRPFSTARRAKAALPAEGS
jgi:hypothetical protein